MPTYEYACKKCGEHLEVVQSFSDDPLKKCPQCRGELRKVFGNIGITFKGSGFYKTDSRPRPKSGGESKSSDTKSSDTKSSDTKSSDTKSSASKGTESKSADTKSSGSDSKSPSSGSKAQAS